MLQEVLKNATNHQHDQLEQLMFVDKIMNGSLSVEEYKQILLTNYLVHAGLESYLHNNLSSDLQQELQIHKRGKLAALKHDLQELNIPQPEINPDKNSIQIPQNNAAILGAMYVLEGATLGGNVIVKKLKINPNLQNKQLNFYYYQVYGSDLVTNWKSFSQVLNTKVASDDYEISVKNALNVFDYFALIMQAIPDLKSIVQA
ncbi:MAG: hypothetical protein EOP42_09930 [Sphingobacteriaceae bacterium]|nr:MAG: hypothetical protein EOP42_09930 [Sphingobacteriaceae bacterium]